MEMRYLWNDRNTSKAKRAEWAANSVQCLWGETHLQASLEQEAAQVHCRERGRNFFRPGEISLPFSACEHTEMIMLDQQSQTLVNRCVDAFIFHATGIKKAFSGWWRQAGKNLLACLLDVPGAHLYDALLTPESLAKISFELRQLLARISEAVRQLSSNFAQNNLTQLLGEEASNLLSVSEQAVTGFGSALNLSGGSVYEKIPTSKANEYYQQCLRLSGEQKIGSLPTYTDLQKDAEVHPHAPWKAAKERPSRIRILRRRVLRWV